jgi:hypothetical protein
MEISSGSLKRLRFDFLQQEIDFFEHWKIPVRFSQGKVGSEFFIEDLFDGEEPV